MQKREVSSDIINDLQKANKYIFVQDFVKADEILKFICQKYENEYEIYFRRIEIAVKSNKIDALLAEFTDLKKSVTNCEALDLAILLAKIKKLALERKNTQSPSLAYSPYSEALFPLNDGFERLPNKRLKLNRSVPIPDDTILPETNEVLLNQENYDSSYIDDVLNEIFSHHKNNPENYAACFLAGCAYDHLGNLETAIRTWKTALLLNPSSICTLSVLSELQQRGHFHEPSEDFSSRLESLDKYLVHGHIETHTDLYNDFILNGDYRNAISSLKILSDWILRQYGTVPIEIEVVCLLGSMNAYKLDKNTIASESCRSEVENVVIGYKRSTTDFSHLVFIAELCEEYELRNLAKICYYTVLTSKIADIEIVRDVASHCVNHYPSEALLLNLRTAYENSKGNPEIRFCIILCSLHLKEVDIVQYMEIKNKIREFIAQNNMEESLPLLEELNLKFRWDPELHYYLAEIYSRKGEINLAQSHFQQMYNLDAYNSEAVVKYIYFLLRNKFYSTAISICKNTVTTETLPLTQINEIRWSLSAAYFAEENYETALQEISKPIVQEPWNVSFLSLHLRCCLHLTDCSQIPDAYSLISKVEESIIEREKAQPNKKEKLVKNLLEYSLFCLRKGFFEIAWSFAKCALIVNKKWNEEISETLSKTAAAYLPHTTIPQLLTLLKTQNEISVSFFEITSCIAKTYGYTGQWSLVDEWLSMAQSHPFTDKMSQSKLFELEALSRTMQGNDLKKAQNLLEAAIDCYGSHEKVPFETKILHGYILVAQGNFAAGIEKMQSSIHENASIQSLYFFMKGLERAGKLSTMSKESIEQMSRVYPLNNFEQKMAEEIFYTVSSKINCVPMGLAS